MKYVTWDLIKGRKKGGVRPLTLKDIMLILFLCPVLLTSGVGAFWLFYLGWEGFTQIVPITVFYGLVGGVFMALLVYVCNAAQRRMTKSKKKSQK
jgi:sterol desaturase/sphingolipid hydroxylase (fatty acid hydroxylase superfamily)